MFDEQCSIYANAKDRLGIGTMAVGDFLFSGKWRSQVEALREMVSRYGALEAKKCDDYKRMKQMLPGATLSGEFSRRRTDCLVRHTGYIAIDIDLVDNLSVSDMQGITYVLRHRPEIACYLRSCSGTGWFALVRLAYPDRHKEQFSALREEYAAIGIQLDKACSDITRIRFATYDDAPYINEHSVPYRGVDLVGQVLAPRAAVREYTDGYTPWSTEDKIDRLVAKLEQHHIDITASYSEWIRVGMSLATLGEVGHRFFHRVSALNPGYKVGEAEAKWRSFHPERSSIGVFFLMCRDYGVTLKD